MLRISCNGIICFIYLSAVGCGMTFGGFLALFRLCFGEKFALVTFCDIQVMFWRRIFRNFLLFDLLDTPLVWFS